MKKVPVFAPSWSKQPGNVVKEAVLPFLGEVLHEAEEEAWQQALDGLVAFATPQSLEILHAARSRPFTEESAARRFLLWLDEATEQVKSELRAKK